MIDLALEEPVVDVASKPLQMKNVPFVAVSDFYVIRRSEFSTFVRCTGGGEVAPRHKPILRTCSLCSSPSCTLLVSRSVFPPPMSRSARCPEHCRLYPIHHRQNERTCCRLRVQRRMHPIRIYAAHVLRTDHYPTCYLHSSPELCRRIDAQLVPARSGWQDLPLQL